MRFRRESWDTDGTALDDENQLIPLVEVYPELEATSAELALEDADELYVPDLIGQILDETRVAPQNRAQILAGAGLRGIVEAICIKERAKGHSLERKIDDLVDKKLLTTSQADLLHRLRYLGNDAVHEMKRPSSADVTAGLKVVRALIETIYVLPHLAKSIKVRKRPRRSGTASTPLPGKRP